MICHSFLELSLEGRKEAGRHVRPSFHLCQQWSLSFHFQRELYKSSKTALSKHLCGNSQKMDDTFKSTGTESNSMLFEKAIPVRITKSSCEDRYAELTVRIVMGLSKHQRSTKFLQVQITNELDPFFLYSLEVNEDDFQTLKVEQCILVDFSTFPHKFIELLEHCIEAGSNDSPRFLAVLQVRTGDSAFSVVETNQFKHLSHLSLCFRQGNDSTIKSYLAGRLAEFKCANADLHGKLRRTLLSLEKALQDVNGLTSELSELKENNSRVISELKEKYMLEIAREKDKAMVKCSELKERLEKERLQMEVRLHLQADTHQGRVAELDKQVHMLMDSNYTLEMKAAEVNNKLEAAEKSLYERQKECDRLRTENCSLDSEKHESAKILNSNLIRLSALEQEVQDKTELLSSLTKQLEVHASHRSALEGSLKDAQVAADRAEEKAIASSAEVNKCGQIIEKLQVDETKGKLDEAQDLIKSNQQMIQWLNQQLTEAQLGRFGTAGFSSRYGFKHSAGCSPNSESFGRGLTNHTATFSNGATLVGTLSKNSSKTIIPSSSYLQSVHSRTMSPVNSLTSSLSATSSKPFSFGRATPVSSPLSSANNGPLKFGNKPTQKNSIGVTTSLDAMATRFSMGLGNVGSSFDVDNLNRALKQGEVCPILPRPQLSFADPKSIVTKEAKMMTPNLSKASVGDSLDDLNSQTPKNSLLSC
ncbi:hypothetical protein O6H91_05G026800 [Diphasiastrum complanatum]|uniref:Uncharacterized protein n=1 Tax=Diphasiastrum complanatum TaxID=34168 RepID=A0ACC2DLR3_DIPCM|nr:hypothetical protein O6H91_05G026800 [Diphasiastrum complanatum]